MNDIKWINFAERPPNNYDSRNRAIEDDPDYCWIIYKYINKPGLRISHEALKFDRGIFVWFADCMLPVYPEYETSLSKDSEYLIEVLFYVVDRDVCNNLFDSFINGSRGVIYEKTILTSL